MDGRRNVPRGITLAAITIAMLAAMVAAGAAPAHAANQSVELQHDEYVPKRVAVKPGEKVFWTNPDDHEEHNVHFEDGSFILPVPPTIGPWTIERQFASLGAFRYYCEIHGAPGGIGMSGTVFVNDAGSLPPTAKLTTSPALAGVGRTVVFSASTSTADTGRQIVKYEWDLDGNGTFETDTLSTPSTSKSFSSPGTVDVRLRVTDDVGQTDVVVQPFRVTAVPTASFSASPSAPKTGQTVTFDASTSSDPDGAIIRYEWDLDGNGSFETDTGATPRASRAYTTAATRTIGLRVTDDEGVASTTTRQLAVTTATAAAPPPTTPATPATVACSSLSGTRRAVCMQKACASVSRSRRSSCYQKSCRHLPRSKRAACVRKSCRWVSRSKRSACMKKSCRYLKGAKKRACARKYSRKS